MKKRKLTWLKSAVIFVGFTVYFYILLFTLYPFLKETFTFNPALNWFITGYFIFIPLFIFSIVSVKHEDNKGFKIIINALNIKKMSKIDLIYSIVGLLIVFIFTGIIFAISFFLNKYYGIRLLSTTPWFMEMQPFKGTEKLLLLVWLPMFFFNIVGEELLWRGYIQSRLAGKLAWLKCSILWMIFHLPFGFDLMIMLIPIILVIPYIYSKTENSITGIFIHGLYNGPIFVMISLGVLDF
jgi:membrane protease YdiL (CAAX protease family)